MVVTGQSTTRRSRQGRCCIRSIPKVMMYYLKMGAKCYQSVSTGGRLIIIGAVSTYKNKSFVNLVAIPTIKLLFNSASVHGFFLPHFAPHYPQHLTKLVSDGYLKCLMDNGASSAFGLSVGLEAAPDAVEYLYSGQSSGKVYVELKHSTNSKLCFLFGIFLTA